MRRSVPIVIAAAVLAGAFWVFAAAFGCRIAEPKQDATSTAQILRTAVELWRRNTGSDECPTIAKLKKDGILDRDMSELDPWGSEYRIQCEPSGIAVTSSGLDQRWETQDDVTIPRSARH
jgi:hypothetical protein